MSLSALGSLPQQLRACILGYLQEAARDMQNYLRLFGWRMRGSFRKDLIPKDVVFEYYDLVAQDQGIDWQFLYFRVMRLLKTSHGIWNRGRIIQLMERVKARIGQCLGEENGLIAWHKQNHAIRGRI